MVFFDPVSVLFFSISVLGLRHALRPQSEELQKKNGAPLICSMRHVHIPQRAQSRYHTQLAKISFDEILDLPAVRRGVFNFYKAN